MVLTGPEPHVVPDPGSACGLESVPLGVFPFLYLFVALVILAPVVSFVSVSFLSALWRTDILQKVL